MRIAFCGTHRTGKTTLVEAVSSLLPGYEVIDEPYRALEEAGHEFSDPPSVEDFEAQLRMSIELVTRAPANALLDRCPLDFVAYAQALDEDFDVDDWRDAIGDAMPRLDLLVVVPIETPDRIALPAHEDARRRVDRRLQELTLDDAWGLEVETLEVTGRLDDRVALVMRAYHRHSQRA